MSVRQYAGMRLTIDNRIRIPFNALSDHEQERLRREFTYANPEHAKLVGMGKRFIPKKIPKYLSSWKIGGGELTVPRGGLQKVIDALGGAVDVAHDYTKGEPELAGDIPDHLFSLRGYQEDLVAHCIRERTALIRSPQGSGKTTVGYAIAARLKLPTLVVVPTEKIFNQWVNNAKAQLGLEPEEVGIIKGNKRIVRPLTIGMQQTLRNCARDYRDTFGVVIGDEAQRFAATTFFEVIDVLRAEYRIGVSADERRADGKEFLVYDVFGQVGMEVSRETLIREGAIIDAEIRVVPSTFSAPWYSKLKPRQRMNSQVQDRLASQIASDAERNALVMEVLEWCVNEGEPTITLAWRREHCGTLNAMCLERGWDSGLLLGGKQGELEFNRSVREMQDGQLMQAVGTYQAVGVGFDLPRVSRGIFAAPCANNNSKQQFGQFCGRYERPEPETGKVNQGDSIIYYIWDREVHGIGHVRNIARWKPKVSVLHDGVFIPAKQYIKEENARAAKKDEDDDEALGFRAVR